MVIRPTIDVSNQAGYLRYVLTKSQELGLGNDLQFLGLLNNYAACPDDREIGQLVRERIARAELENLVAPNPFRAANLGTDGILKGSIGLGVIEDANIPWAVSPKLLTNNMLCVGRSGGGKTNLLLLALAQVLQKSLARVRIFDRKLDASCLSVFPNFIYWLLEDYYTNWIQPPPGLQYRCWIPMLYEIFANYLDIRVAGRNLLTSATLWACEQRKSDQSGDYPTLKDIRNIIRSRKYPLQSHHARYQETVLNRIDGLVDVFGEHICSKRQLDWNRFLETSWAISLFGIPTDYQNLFISVTAGSILLHKMSMNCERGMIDLFVFDEASTMFKRSHEAAETTYVLTDFLAKCREFDIGFLVATQTLSNLADSVLANTATKIMVGGAGLGQDYDIFASAIGLTREQKEFVKQRTRPGQACAKDPRYPFPFTMKVPRIC